MTFGTPGIPDKHIDLDKDGLVDVANSTLTLKKLYELMRRSLN
jgi:hypothetical protein